MGRIRIKGKTRRGTILLAGLPLLAALLLAAAVTAFLTGCEDIGLRATIDDLTTGYEWVKVAKLTAPTRLGNEYFGYSVSIDDDFAIVGAFNNSETNTGQGKAYIYRNNDGKWSYLTTLEASDGAAGHGFGWSVAVSGNYAVVGAPGYAVGQGSAYLYQWNGSSWITPTALQTDNGRLEIPGGASPVEMGYSVSISGKYAVVGAPGENSNVGATYIYYKDQDGSNYWGYQLRLTTGEGDFDRYGESVSIYQDYLLSGAKSDDEGETNSGAAYLYKRSGVNWPQVSTRIKNASPKSDEYFASSVSLCDEHMLFGAPNENKSYVYKYTSNSWKYLSSIESTSIEPVDRYGYSVSISEDFALIGASYHDTKSVPNSGASYIFSREDDWDQFGTIISSDPEADDELGASVSITEDYLIVGIPYDNNGGTSNCGAALVYEKREK